MEREVSGRDARWRSQEADFGELAARLTGSADLYQDDGRKPYASINFITAHDGFTLRDLVSYNDKHNEAKGAENRDGESHYRSWNLGAEGPTEDPSIPAWRARQQRNFLATLFLSQGVPMLVGGDEIGRTQQGNNDGYCQEDEISWRRPRSHRAGRQLPAAVQLARRCGRLQPRMRNGGGGTRFRQDYGPFRSRRVKRSPTFSAIGDRTPGHRGVDRIRVRKASPASDDAAATILAPISVPAPTLPDSR